jgi:calcineurin-like phosphoesterase family protein
VVQPDDTIHHLGDMFFCSQARAHSILDQLPGKIHLILGNHDKMIVNTDLRDRFMSIRELDVIKIKGLPRIAICHYPMRAWSGSHHGSLHCHGHSHGNIAPYPNSLDVSLENTNYYPIKLEDVIKRIETERDQYG